MQQKVCNTCHSYILVGIFKGMQVQSENYGNINCDMWEGKIRKLF